ncbi:basic helix-loop-helix protein A-like [Vigna unguiculata]|uniref:basic helix-loop-helix protein A-like n=1 Tax=Vigna unguiculata TaxID=3917 RepID=UPI001015DD8B|nr:basic helix-loop-helix protein A-like [Vigna unguiculata]XP_027923867.1 basic helix-loop-helix protein A-like [Vigna unguiculata]
MAAPPNSRLQSMLRAAVQSVQWTYTLFWQLCPQQGILTWGDGYYNGAIKTRKTVQAMEVSTEEASLQRSEQLRELYESLSAGEANSQTRRPCAALSPEDLTESEWFYLLCVSFSFHPGVGLPGTAYARRQHIWLTGANEVESKAFSRAILAKSAHIQTVVCIPVLDGVVELGTTDKVEEDLNFIQHIKSFFIEQHPPTAKPALSEHSTSNPTSSSYPVVVTATTAPPNNIPNQNDIVDKGKEVKLNSETAGLVVRSNTFIPTELMELDTLEGFRVGSPGDGSNHLDSFPTEASMALCSAGLELLQLQLPPQPPEHPPSENIAQGDTDTHYSQTVSSILQKNSGWWPDSPSVNHLTDSFQSAFNKWNSGTDEYRGQFHMTVADVTSQWLLKYILFSVPYLHANRVKGKGAPSYETSHVMAERRRREKLNERFLILRSMVPFVTRMDKASILGDTIEYIKQLREKIESLEARERHAGKRRVREVEVSIIEGDALLEVECVHREGLLLDVMTLLRELGVDVMMVQSWVRDDGVFVAEMRAKVKDNGNGEKASIVEVKNALNQIIPRHIPHHDPYTLPSNDHF